MMAPTRHKAREETMEDKEDISQLRKPITLHGQPVEQILNGIHYGSPELRSLLMNECDMIFECKVCRSLFRDLPNFMAHKRRYCTESASERNHIAIAEIPNERVVIVHPQPVEDSTPLRSSPRAGTPRRQCLEEALQRIHSGESGHSHAFKVYSNAADKLQHQKEHTKITSIRTREIPTNSNAVFVDVNTTSVNIHDRSLANCNNDKSNTCTSVKTAIRKNGEKNKDREKGDRLHLRSRSSNKPKEESEELNGRLLRELKGIQNKAKNKTVSQNSVKIQDNYIDKTSVKNDSSKSNLRVENEHVVVISDFRSDGKTKTKDLEDKSVAMLKSNDDEDDKMSERDIPSPGRWSNFDDAGLVEVTRQNSKASLSKKQKALAKLNADSPSKSSSDSGMTISNEDLRSSKKSLICANCGLIFSSRKSLLFHVSMHHAVKRTFYPCPMCSNLYYYVSAVTRHMIINHKLSKAESNSFRKEITKKAFSKPVPSNDSPTVFKRNVAGTQRSLRFHGGSLNNNKKKNSYVYSAVANNRRKELLAKKQLALKESGNTDDVKKAIIKVLNMESSSKMHKAKETMNEPKIDKVCLKIKQNEILKSERNVFDDLKAISTAKLLTGHDIDSQMISCPKCSRLFGRKITFEKHIKRCEGNISEEDSSASTSRSSHSSKSSFSTRSKVKENNIGSSVLLPPADMLVNAHWQNNSPSTKDEVDSGDLSKLSQAVTSHKESPLTVIKGSSGKDTLDQSESFNESSFTATRFNSRGGSDILGVKSVAHSNFHTRRSGLDNCKTDNTVSTSDVNENVMSVGKDLGNCVINESKQSHKILPGKDGSIFNSGREVKVDVKQQESKKAVTIMERPRRKRKIPSRNIGATEFFKKINLLDEDEPVEKAMKNCSTKGTKSGGNKRKKNGENKEPLNIKMNGDIDDLSRKRRHTTRVFVLNSNNSGMNTKSKLRCYNHNKIENFVDSANCSCLKCGARFTFINNLKRHIVRLHLKWSRFKCKLCNFTSFDKSECKTHIARSHRSGKRAARNCSVNSLIVDLTEKGSKAMSIKKCETLKANSRQQISERNVYKNQIAKKNLRLSERMPDTDLSLSTPSEKVKSQQVEKKRDSTVDKVFKENNVIVPSPSTSAAMDKSKVVELLSASDKLKPLQAQMTGIDRTLELKANIPQTVSFPGSSSLPTDKTKQTDDQTKSQTEKELTIANKVSTTDPNDSNSNNCVNATSTSSVSSTSRKPNLPFNISTRNSPRVFDTTPYNRAEHETTATITSASVSVPVVTTATLVEQMPLSPVLHTRHSVYTKTLPALVIKSHTQTSLAQAGSESQVKESVDTQSTKTDTPICDTEGNGSEVETKCEIVSDKIKHSID